jgi:hypothetical protein
MRNKAALDQFFGFHCRAPRTTLPVDLDTSAIPVLRHATEALAGLLQADPQATRSVIMLLATDACGTARAAALCLL